MLPDVRANPLLADLIPSYLAARRREVGALRICASVDAFDEIRAIAHRLKGTGGTYGQPQLTAIGLVLETAAARADHDGVVRAVEQLADELGARS